MDQNRQRRWLAPCSGLGLAALVLLAGAPASASPGTTDFFAPPAVVGAHFSNVYSIAVSTKADGFDEKVGRNSGSSDYTLKADAADHALTFDESDAYDGRPISRGETVVRDHGQTLCWNGKCRTATDASGLLYNRLLWGSPPAHLAPGMSWRVDIPQAWELGPAGAQTVTVVAVDDREARLL